MCRKGQMKEFVYHTSNNNLAETLSVHILIFHTQNFNLSSSIKNLYYNLIKY